VNLAKEPGQVRFAGRPRQRPGLSQEVPRAYGIDQAREMIMLEIGVELAHRRELAIDRFGG